MSPCTNCNEPAAHVLVTVPFHREFPITVRHRCPGCDTVFDEAARDNAAVLTAALRGTGLAVVTEAGRAHLAAIDYTKAVGLLSGEDEVHDDGDDAKHPAEDGRRLEGRLQDEQGARGDPGKAEAAPQHGNVGGHAPASASPPQEVHGSGQCSFRKRSAENPNAFWACQAAPGDAEHALPPNAQGIGDWRTLP